MSVSGFTVFASHPSLCLKALFKTVCIGLRICLCNTSLRQKVALYLKNLVQCFSSSFAACILGYCSMCDTASIGSIAVYRVEEQSSAIVLK
ncbi:hypothetical protein FKM82_027378 [Ascaphus truei]